ncbi:hypothetical protein AVEN_125870-1 [Araneus ventricosus]|uniref:Uncharacterized protein n=1 Tax=Araneus ventricosus TaxID=182803 RepID=A0A4Y2F6F4_ARAVE|nr:hypothetical protein AVEN_125870-1 [Araneus ventricosus]
MVYSATFQNHPKNMHLQYFLASILLCECFFNNLIIIKTKATSSPLIRALYNEYSKIPKHRYSSFILHGRMTLEDSATSMKPDSSRCGNHSSTRPQHQQDSHQEGEKFPSGDSMVAVLLWIE